MLTDKQNRKASPELWSIGTVNFVSFLVLTLGAHFFEDSFGFFIDICMWLLYMYTYDSDTNLFTRGDVQGY